jgi:hypothetical protein
MPRWLYGVPEHFLNLYAAGKPLFARAPDVLIPLYIKERKKYAEIMASLITDYML